MIWDRERYIAHSLFEDTGREMFCELFCNFRNRTDRLPDRVDGRHKVCQHFVLGSVLEPVDPLFGGLIICRTDQPINRFGGGEENGAGF